jgi:hypothetical protein
MNDHCAISAPRWLPEHLTRRRRAPIVNPDQFAAATGHNQVLWQIVDEVAALGRISEDVLFGRSRRLMSARAPVRHVGSTAARHRVR